MIYDNLSNFEKYSVFTDDATKKICEFWGSLNADIAEGTHEIDGKLIYAGVQNYTTKDFGTSDLEIHKKYVDIQLLVVGEEAVYCSAYESLQESIAYDDEKDCAFYKLDEKIASLINLQIGKFAIFFPYEGHMPCIDHYCGKSDVKKIVVKIAKELLK